MWMKTDITIKNINYLSYRNAISGSNVTEILFSKIFNDHDECIISCVSTKTANEIFDILTQVCPFFAHNPYTSNNMVCYGEGNELMLTDIKFSLFKQKAIDLEQVSKNLSMIIDELPEEVLNIITSNHRKLEDLEIEFYNGLQNLTKDNFSSLLKMAKNIVSEEYNANALWELANACKNSSELLIEEWIESLKSIKPYSNYYAHASSELTYFTLSNPVFEEYPDFQNSSSTDTLDILNKQKIWLKNGLRYAFGMNNHGVDVIKKMTLTFLNKNWIEEEQVFPTKECAFGEEKLYYCLDLLMFTRSLSEENCKLKSQQKLSTEENPDLFLKLSI